MIVSTVTETLNGNETVSVRPQLEDLARTLIVDASGEGDPQTGLRNLVRRIAELCQADGVAILQQAHGRWSVDRQLVQPVSWADAVAELGQVCELAAGPVRRQRCEALALSAASDAVVVTVPLEVGPTHQSVLAALFRDTPDRLGMQRRMLMLQLLAPTLVHLLQRSLQRPALLAQVDRLLLETVMRADSAGPFRPALQHAVDRIPRLLPVTQVFVARGRRSLRLEFVSGSARFDPHAELSRLAISVMEQGMLSTPPSLTPQWVSVSAIAAADQLRRTAGHDHLWLVVWRRDAASPCTAMLFASRQPAPQANSEVSEACQRLLTTLVRVSELNERSWHRPLTPAAAWWSRQSVRARQLLAATAVLAMATLLAIPMPYRVKATATLQPVHRRYVAVPYEGRLESTYVKPGDVVAAGQLIARMDDRELAWNLAGLKADLERARKQRDSAMADRDTAKSQMARLEMDRLSLKIRLLDEQTANLEIKSPLRGIVVSGDPEKIEGARVAMGQTIAEIAPLDKMLVEVQIPDREIRQVHEGARVTVRFDSAADRAFRGQISRIHPRAEQRDGHNVFIATVELENTHDQLRPGMNGKASIVGEKHCLAWNLFHPAWDQFRYWTSW
ncbi:MAG: efflux RND transporter periplasmic adaptor subunit [Pirellulales bacterium]